MVDQSYNNFNARPPLALGPQPAHALESPPELLVEERSKMRRTASFESSLSSDLQEPQGRQPSHASIWDTATTKNSALNSEASEPKGNAIDRKGSRVNQDEQKPVLSFENPEWLEVFFDFFGISDLLHSLEKEREKRAPGGDYQNPFPEIFNFVISPKFEVTVAVMILLNCFTIGLEATIEEGSSPGFFSFSEHFFVLFFVAEWILRNVAFGWIWIFEMNNFLDTVLVFGTGVLLKWLLEPVGVNVKQFRMFTVLRALRLVRFVYAVRLQPFFKELWILIQGLITSLRPLAWVFVIASCILYIFGVSATELIGRSPLFEEDEYIQELFGNVLRSIFSMFQLMTMDTYFDEIVRPVMRKEPLLGIFFISFVLLAVFVFWNLITAVIVDTAFAISKADTENQAKENEQEKKEELKALADIFLEIDQDGSGDLNKAEFFSSLDNPKIKNLITLLRLNREELEETWETLDMADGNGILTIKEFTNGIRRMKGDAKSKDIIDVCKRLRQTEDRCHEAQLQVDAFGQELGVLEKDIASIAKDTSEVLGLFQEMFFRLDVYCKNCANADELKAQKRRMQRMRELGVIP